jgi:hypothetical protein
MRGEYTIVDPGKTSVVQIGGVGRPVVGHFVPPADLQWPGDWTVGGDWRYLTTLHRDGPRLVNPVQHSPNETPEQYRAAEIAFGRTPQGKLYKNWQFGRLFNIEKDGSFRIDDLPPGMYGFYVSITQYDREVEFLENRATLNQNFVVIPFVGERIDEAQDLGVIDMQSVTSYRKGERITPFDLVTHDGRSHPLKEFSGKYVLIYSFSTDASATWQRGEVEAFKKEMRPWMADSRLAVVWMGWGSWGASGGSQALSASAKSLGLEGMLSDSNGQLPERLQPTVGTAMLIGPDQTLVQNHIMSRSVAKILKAHLPATQPAESITSRSTP